MRRDFLIVATAVSVMALAACPAPAAAKRCPDGRYRIVCPNGPRGGGFGPTFLPIPPDFKNRNDYVHAVRDIRAKTIADHQAHRISDATFKNRMGQIHQAIGE